MLATERTGLVDDPGLHEGRPCLATSAQNLAVAGNLRLLPTFRRPHWTVLFDGPSGADWSVPEKVEA